MISVHDDAIDQSLKGRLTELMAQPIWAYGWQSLPDKTHPAYWNAHFAGGNGTRVSCETELANKPRVRPIYDLWMVLKNGVMAGHHPIRIYANAHTYGVEGRPHVDSIESHYMTSIYYAHESWQPSWAGETVFFAENGIDIFSAITPHPGRLVIFPGNILHAARSPSRDCIGLRTTIVFKTKLSASN